MADVLTCAYQPGMPDCIFAPPAGVAADVALTSDDPVALAAFGPPVWGIYSSDTFEPVIVCDTVMEVSYAKASGVSSYPIEAGGFSDYDKQAMPFEGRVRFASGGSSDAREALLASIEAIIGDTSLYDLVTRDRVYLNCNLTKMEYTRAAAAGGASLLVIDVSVQEVRVRPVPGPVGFSPRDPASANAIDGGTIQPQPATPAQTAAALPFFASGAPLSPTLGGRGF